MKVNRVWLGTGLVLCCLAISILPSCKNEKADNQQETVNGATGNSAIDNLTKAIGSDPENADLYAQRARLFYDNEGYDEAIQDLSAALTLDSTNVDYHHMLADVYMDYFKSRLALKTMERAAALYPDRIPTLLKLSEFQLILKQYEQSLKTINHVLELDPQNADGYFMLGMVLKETGDTTRAINSFQNAVEIEPEMVDAWINLGQLHARIKGNLAGQFFDNAIKIAPDNPTALHAKASFLADQGDFKGAIDLYRKINIADPQYEEGYFNSGLLYLEMDSLQQAYKLFDLTIKVDPLHIRAYFFRGYAEEHLGKPDDAIKDYQQALRLAPEYELAKEGLARLSKGN